jgi:hypothetical protein
VHGSSSYDYGKTIGTQDAWEVSSGSFVWISGDVGSARYFEISIVRSYEIGKFSLDLHSRRSGR